MVRKYDFECIICNEQFLDVNELAMHQLKHLVITLPFLELCPFCEEEKKILRDCCKHVLSHFSRDKLEQCKILKWLGELNHFRNDQTNFTKNLVKSVPLSGSGLVKNIEIRLPVILPCLKCLFCAKLYAPDRILEHLFSHFRIPKVREERILLWFERFFLSKDGKIIEQEYVKYFSAAKKLNKSSTLLEKLPMFENKWTNTCRYCKMKVCNVSELYAHYVEWHSTSRVKSWNCSICNRKLQNETNFLAHIYENHLRCIFCNNKFSSFAALLMHSHVEVYSINNRSGCKKQKKLSFEILMENLNNGKKEVICPFCSQRRNNVRDLRFHVKHCSKRQFVGVYCPCCRNAHFQQEEKLKAHILECKPWLPSVNNKPPCSEVKIEDQNIIQGNNLVNFIEIRQFLRPDAIDRIKEYLL